MTASENEKQENTIFSDDYLEKLVDDINVLTDLNNDGYISFPEFIIRHTAKANQENNKENADQKK